MNASKTSRLLRQAGSGWARVNYFRNRGCDYRRHCLILLNIRPEAESPAREGPYHLLSLTVVSDSIAGCTDPTTHRSVRHDPAVPDRFNELVLGDDAIAILD